MKRSAIVPVPPLSLDRERALPKQISEGLRAAMQSGRLSLNARVPATRALARALGVSRQVVVAAYEDLVASGHLRGRVGAGSYVVGTGRQMWTSGPAHTLADPDGHAILVWRLQ